MKVVIATLIAAVVTAGVLVKAQSAETAQVLKTRSAQIESIIDNVK